MKNNRWSAVPVYAAKLISCFPRAASLGRLLPGLILLIFALLGFPPGGNAQKTGRKNVPQINGKLRILVPAGIIGNSYWIYLNERLKSAPPHGTPANKQNIISLPGGGWEVWAAEGRILSSQQYDKIIDSYLAAGDKYQIFQTTEYPVSPGNYTIEVVIPLSYGNSSSLAPLPFVITRKHEVTVQPGQTLEVLTEIPTDWNNRWQVGVASDAGTLCSRPSFNLNRTKENFIYWGNAYKNDALVKILHAAKVTFNPGSRVVILNLPGGSREFDAAQVEQIINVIKLRFSGQFKQSEIDECKRRFPEYSKAFAGFAQVIDLIEDDIKSFDKLAAALKSNQ